MINTYFSRFAQKSSEALGSVPAFIITVVIIVTWTVGGIVKGFPDTYQLVINTVSTLTTSIIVVLVQRSQTLVQESQARQEEAIQRKLDELIKALDKADNRLIGLEKQPLPGGQASAP